MANRLIHELSPYLKQHAHNPVDWFPWGDDAWAKARTENKPVFLSVGYSTCHWCHVMERESFENPQVAALLNAYFVPVKVDREERPDIDHIYMMAAQIMTGRGGWPLTVILTPDGVPVFAATYLPPMDRLGLAGLIPILDRIARLWDDNPAVLLDTATRMQQIMRESIHPESGSFDISLIHRAYEDLKARFDPESGGFLPAPKFPTPHHLQFLLRYHHVFPNSEALDMVQLTLDQMHRGGIWDQVGFGFSRYSVDARWQVPHFEKMLYDNALMAMVYLEAYQVTRNNPYAQTARQILAYIQRDMTAPDGAFYTAEDADSEGEEGRFYTWTPAEITAVLGEVDGARFNRLFGVTATGNFEGRTILHLPADSPVEDDPWIASCQDRLQVARNDRVRPLRDTKILTGWNGLMIASLAVAGRVLEDPGYTRMATAAWYALRQQAFRDDGRLLTRTGRQAPLAYLDDYAYLAWGLLELLETTGDRGYLEEALKLARGMVHLFSIPDQNALAMTGTDAESLLVHPVQLWDGALPSGNGTAAAVFTRLTHLCGSNEWDPVLQRIFSALGGAARKQPAGHTAAGSAYLASMHPGPNVVIRLPEPGDDQAFRKVIHARFLPFATTLTIIDPVDPWITLTSFPAGLPVQDGLLTLYLCHGFSCQTPIHHLADFKSAMEKTVNPS
jgi:hypothetical protein